MKNELDIFARLAAEVGCEPTLPAFVADRVIATLQARNNSTLPTDKVGWLLGIGSFIAACATLVLFLLAARAETLFAFDQLFVLVLP